VENHGDEPKRKVARRAAPLSPTNMATTGGTIQFVDPVATNIHARYYRTVMP
jgi:hypothetical protein